MVLSDGEEPVIVWGEDAGSGDVRVPSRLNLTGGRDRLVSEE